MNRGSQFPDNTDEHVDGGDGIPEIRRLSRGSSYVEYEHDPEVKRTNILYMNSGDEGRGNAQALLHQLYGNNPEHTVHWGEVMHPAAAHIMKKMSKQYGRTTGSVNINEDYAKELGQQ